jgi:hypothetical protein
MTIQQIIAMGGGGFSMVLDNPALDQYVVSQTHKPKNLLPGNSQRCRRKLCTAFS